MEVQVLLGAPCPRRSTEDRVFHIHEMEVRLLPWAPCPVSSMVRRFKVALLVLLLNKYQKNRRRAIRLAVGH